MGKLMLLLIASAIFLIIEVAGYRELSDEELKLTLGRTNTQERAEPRPSPNARQTQSFRFAGNRPITQPTSNPTSNLPQRNKGKHKQTFSSSDLERAQQAQERHMQQDLKALHKHVGQTPQRNKGKGKMTPSVQSAVRAKDPEPIQKKLKTREDASWSGWAQQEPLGANEWADPIYHEDRRRNFPVSGNANNLPAQTPNYPPNFPFSTPNNNYPVQPPDAFALETNQISLARLIQLGYSPSDIEAMNVPLTLSDRSILSQMTGSLYNTVYYPKPQ